jgi:hypothetical protein
MIRRHGVEICQNLIDDEMGFAGRGDQASVYLTLAEALDRLEHIADEDRLAPTIAGLATEFGRRSRLEQRPKLLRAIDDFRLRIRPDGLRARTAPDKAGHATASLNPATDNAARRSITVDADLEPGKSIKASKLICKIVCR